MTSSMGNFPTSSCGERQLRPIKLKERGTRTERVKASGIIIAIVKTVLSIITTQAMLRVIVTMVTKGTLRCWRNLALVSTDFHCRGQEFCPMVHYMVWMRKVCEVYYTLCYCKADLLSLCGWCNCPHQPCKPGCLFWHSFHVQCVSICKPQCLPTLLLGHSRKDPLPSTEEISAIWKGGGGGGQCTSSNSKMH